MHIIYTIVCACMCTLVTYTSAKWPISAPIAMALCAPGDAKAPAASNRAGKACFWRCEPCWFPRFDAKNVVLFPQQLYMYIATSWCLTHKSLHVIKTWNKIWHTFFKYLWFMCLRMMKHIVWNCHSNSILVTPFQWLAEPSWQLISPSFPTSSVHAFNINTFEI